VHLLSPHSFFLSAHPRSFLLLSLFFPAKAIFLYLFIMTNYTKKRTNNAAHTSEDHSSRESSGSRSGSDPGNLTREELQEQNKELQRRLQKYKGVSFLLFLDEKTKFIYYRKA
jgi:hypothetical protein